MFKDSHKAEMHRTAKSLAASVAEWREARDNTDWFDGKPETVDRHLANLRGMLHKAKSASGRYRLPNEDHLQVIAELEEDRRSLEGLRRDLLNGSADRQNVTSSVGRRVSNLSSEERRYVELESQNFFALNMDCLSDPEELSFRAKRHAELQTSQLTVARQKQVVAAFVNKVEELGRQAPSRQAKIAEKVSLDFDDQCLFD